IDITRSWSAFATSTSISRWRFRLLVFFVNMCRACEWPRLIFPVAVSRTRLAAPLWVLSFGMIDSLLLINLLTVGRLWLGGAASLMSLWPKDDKHLVSFHPRARFNFTNIGEVLLEFFQYARPEFTVRHLATAKPDRRFNLVALLEPLARMLHAIFVVVIVRSRSKLYFLDRDRYLLFLRLVCLLLRFVLILSEIDDATNRRIGVRSDLDQVQAFFPGGTHGIAHVHHAQLFSFLTNHAYLGHANSFVNPNRRHAPVIRTLTATSKACSYSAPPKVSAS